MDTRTGEVFELDPDGALSRTSRRKLERDQAKLEAKAQRLEDARRAGALVPISEAVAEQLRAGQRELARSKRRRKASRDARKRNRRG